MRNYTVDLKKEYGLKGGILECILANRPFDSDKDWKRPALIVVPGGGYGMVSKREGEPIAFEFLSRGYQVFVLTYTVGGEKGEYYPEQLLQLSAAVDYVKKNAEAMNVNPNEIFAVGFSAGGHLVGDLAVECDTVSEKAGFALNARPTAVGLIYPVISDIEGHIGSYNNLLYGYTDEAKAELLKTLRLNERVTENTPPAFLWATAEDKTVPASNAIRYAAACASNGVPYELHILPQGRHGLSTGSKEINEDAPGLSRVNHRLGDCDKFFRIYIEEQF